MYCLPLSRERKKKWNMNIISQLCCPLNKKVNSTHENHMCTVYLFQSAISKKQNQKIMKISSAKIKIHCKIQKNIFCLCTVYLFQNRTRRNKNTNKIEIHCKTQKNVFCLCTVYLFWNRTRRNKNENIVCRLQKSPVYCLLFSNQKLKQNKTI